MRRTGPLLALLAFAIGVLVVVGVGLGLRKKTAEPVAEAADAQVASAGEPEAGAVDAAPPAPLTPADRLEQHRKEMAEAAEAGHYADVCKGTPWVNATVCGWAAARAAGR